MGAQRHGAATRLYLGETSFSVRKALPNEGPGRGSTAGALRGNFPRYKSFRGRLKIVCSFSFSSSSFLVSAFVLLHDPFHWWMALGGR